MDKKIKNKQNFDKFVKKNQNFIINIWPIKKLCLPLQRN